MPKVIYIEYNGTSHEVDVPAGENIMRGALYNNIPGIAGECGGAPSCATCRCFVDNGWATKVGGPVSHEERELLAGIEDLDAAEGPGTSNVRLSCQITMTSDLDGLIVHLPEKQFA